jgi:hypothetical protein
MMQVLNRTLDANDVDKLLAHVNASDIVGEG